MNQKVRDLERNAAKWKEMYLEESKNKKELEEQLARQDVFARDEANKYEHQIQILKKKERRMAEELEELKNRHEPQLFFERPKEGLEKSSQEEPGRRKIE